MKRLTHPFLQRFCDPFTECLLQRAHSLGQFEATPPQPIFVRETNLPQALRRLKVTEDWQVRKLVVSNSHHFRLFYLILLKLCFHGSDDLLYLKRLLQTIFDKSFEIGFSSSTNGDPKLFNSNQFKKLFVDLLYLLDMQESPDIEAELGKYPLVDIVIIHILKSLLKSRGIFCDAGREITNEVVFKELCGHFSIPFLKVEGGYVLASVVVSEEIPCYLVAAFEPESPCSSTHRSTSSKINNLEEEESCFKESVVNEYKVGSQLPFNSFVRGYSFSNTPVEESDKEALSDYYPDLFESQVLPITSTITDPMPLGSKLSTLPRDSIVTPIQKVFSKLKPKKVNLGEELRKSQMRVSMMRVNEAKSKEKVSTESIFCRERYFSQLKFATDSEIDGETNPHYYPLSAISPNAPPTSRKQFKNQDKVPFPKHSLFRRQIEEETPESASLGPRPKETSDESYYRDFTSSFLLEQLPEQTKSSIRSLKHNFMKQRSHIRML